MYKRAISVGLLFESHAFLIKVRSSAFVIIYFVDCIECGFCYAE